MVLSLPTGMQDHLDTKATTLCFCWKITKTDNTVVGFTNHDKNIVIDSVTYLAETGFTPSVVKEVMGPAVDDMEVIGFLSANALEEDDILNKLYDNAAISVYRVNWNDTTQYVEVFTGYLGTITRGEISFTAEVRSLRQLLMQVEGKRYMPTCSAVLGDAKCGIDLSSDITYRIDGTVETVYSQRLISTTTAAILDRNAGWFTAGKLTWTSGNNNGFVSEVKAHNLQVSATEAWIELWDAALTTLQVGDTFTVEVGCVKSIEICKNKFNNVVNFRGFPRMPRTNIAIKVASSADVYTNETNGGSWYKN